MSSLKQNTANESEQKSGSDLNNSIADIGLDDDTPDTSFTTEDSQDDSKMISSTSTNSNAPEPTNYNVSQIEISKIMVSDDRRKIDEESISDLAASIETLGLLHPIVVSRDMYLVAGNHRLTAHKHLGKKFINAFVLSVDKNTPDSKMIELSENTDRVELTKLEKAVSAFEMYIARKNNTRWLSKDKDKFSIRNKKLLTTTSAIPEIMKKFNISRSEAYALIDLAGKLVPEATPHLTALDLADNMAVVKEFSELQSTQQTNLISQGLAKKEFVQEMKDLTKRNKHTSDKPIPMSTTEKKDLALEEIKQQISNLNSKGLQLDFGIVSDNGFHLKKNDSLVQEFKSLNNASWYIKGVEMATKSLPDVS